MSSIMLKLVTSTILEIYKLISLHFYGKQFMISVKIFISLDSINLFFLLNYIIEIL